MEPEHRNSPVEVVKKKVEEKVPIRLYDAG